MKHSFRLLPILSAASLALFLIGLPCLLMAHVTVWPRESSTGAYEKYVVRAPTEGKVATQSVELTLPEGMTFISMAVPTGYTYELKRAGDRVSGIVWSLEIPPGEFAEFAFMARNPKEPGPIVWKAIQRLKDGSTVEWVGPAGDRRPASVTKISAGEAPGH